MQFYFLSNHHDEIIGHHSVQIIEIPWKLKQKRAANYVGFVPVVIAYV